MGKGRERTVKTMVRIITPTPASLPLALVAMPADHRTIRPMGMFSISLATMRRQRKSFALASSETSRGLYVWMGGLGGWEAHTTPTRRKTYRGSPSFS